MKLLVLLVAVVVVQGATVVKRSLGSGDLSRFWLKTGQEGDDEFDDKLSKLLSLSTGDGFYAEGGPVKYDNSPLAPHPKAGCSCDAINALRKRVDDIVKRLDGLLDREEPAAIPETLDEKEEEEEDSDKKPVVAAVDRSSASSPIGSGRPVSVPATGNAAGALPAKKAVVAAVGRTANANVDTARPSTSDNKVAVASRGGSAPIGSGRSASVPSTGNAAGALPAKKAVVAAVGRSVNVESARPASTDNKAPVVPIRG